MAAPSFPNQLVAIVIVLPVNAQNSLAGTKAIRVIGVCEGVGAVGHGSQLSAMRPCESPCAVVGRIAYAILLNGNTVVCRQQVTPVAVAVGVGDCIRRRAQRPGGVGVLRPGGDVACVVVSPDMGEAARLIVLPDQLVGAVVDVGCGVGAVVTVFFVRIPSALYS